MHHHFTFRASGTGMVEDRLIRGLHPYIARRMQLERLREFRPHPLPSSDERSTSSGAWRGTTPRTTASSPSRRSVT